MKCRKCLFPDHTTDECNDSCPICGQSARRCWGIMRCYSKYFPSISARFACGLQRDPPVTERTILPYHLEQEVRSIVHQQETLRLSHAEANAFGHLTPATWMKARQTALERQGQMIIDLQGSRSDPMTHSESAVPRDPYTGNHVNGTLLTLGTGRNWAEIQVTESKTFQHATRYPRMQMWSRSWASHNQLKFIPSDLLD